MPLLKLTNAVNFNYISSFFTLFYAYGIKFWIIEARTELWQPFACFDINCLVLHGRGLHSSHSALTLSKLRARRLVWHLLTWVHANEMQDKATYSRSRAGLRHCGNYAGLDTVAENSWRGGFFYTYLVPTKAVMWPENFSLGYFSRRKKYPHSRANRPWVDRMIRYKEPWKRTFLS